MEAAEILLVQEIMNRMIIKWIGSPNRFWLLLGT